MSAKKRFYFVFIALMFFLFAVSFVSSASAKTIKMNLTHVFPAAHPISAAHQYFADEIFKRTDGKVQITVFPSGTLISSAKLYDGIVTGIVDIGSPAVAYTPGRLSASEAVHVPLPSKSAWVTTHIADDFQRKFDPKESHDVHVLFAHACGNYIIGTCNKAARTLEDFRGLKMRASGAAGVAYAKALGASPEAMAMGEVYEAAAKGVIDSLLVPFETMKAFKHAEVTKCITVPPVSFCNTQLTSMNLEKWNSLPEDIQKVFAEVSLEMTEKIARTWWYIDIKAQEYFLTLGEGRELIEIPAEEKPKWDEALAPLVDTYIKENEAKSIPASKYVKYVQERAEYWNAHHLDEKSCMEWVEKNLIK
jgi:TRAP-type C4-dicarboxylate transport system substrate-binding protein